MTFSLLTISILGISAAVVYREIRKGYRSGLPKSLIRLAVLVFCAFFSSVLSTFLGDIFGGMLFVALKNLAVLAEICEDFSFLLGAAELLIKMLFSLVLYLPIFFITKLILSVLIRIFCAIIKSKKGSSPNKGAPEYLSEDAPFYMVHDKKLGAVVGVLSGLLLTIVVFMPFTGILQSASDVVDTVVEVTQMPELLTLEGLRLIDRYGDDASVVVIQSCGGKTLYNLTSRASYEDKSTYLNREIAAVRSFDLRAFGACLNKGGGIATGNTQELSTFLDRTKDSLALSIVTTDIVQGASKAWFSDVSYLGLNRPNLGENEGIDQFFNSILQVCATTDVDTYVADMHTVLGLIDILGDYEFLFQEHDYETFMTVFVEDNALQRIEDELTKNPRMSHVRLNLNDIIIGIIADEIGGDRYTDTQKGVFYRGVSEALNDAQGLTGSAKIQSVANSIAACFAEQGVYLPENIETKMAQILITRFSTAQEVSPDDIEQLFGEYALEDNIFDETESTEKFFEKNGQ